MRELRLAGCLFAAIVALVALPASGESPTLQDFLTAMDISPKDVERTRAGEFITGTAKLSNDREIVATLAFLARNIQPDELVARLKQGLLDATDKQTIVFSIIPDSPTLESFKDLRLRKESVRKFARAKPGDDTNFSAEEIEALGKLGKKPTAEQVEQVIHAALLTRVEAYKAAGLAGIAPYLRSRSKERFPGVDLELASLATPTIEKVTPDVYRLLLEYPTSIPQGTQESYRWNYLEANGEPTIVLSHNLYVPEGEIWIVIQRHIYVSEGYNCEQAVAAFVPVAEGTAVFYANRTSTDQVSGFGGSLKRSIGSKMLANTLKALFAMVTEATEDAGSPAPD
jgi:hypothetical protein